MLMFIVSKSNTNSRLSKVLNCDLYIHLIGVINSGSCEPTWLAPPCGVGWNIQAFYRATNALNFVFVFFARKNKLPTWFLATPTACSQIKASSHSWSRPTHTFLWSTSHSTAAPRPLGSSSSHATTHYTQTHSTEHDLPCMWLGFGHGSCSCRCLKPPDEGAVAAREMQSSWICPQARRKSPAAITAMQAGTTPPGHASLKWSK